MIDSDNLETGDSNQVVPSYLTAYLRRFIRTTKFPRIGRSSMDFEDLPTYFKIKSKLDSDETDETDEFERRSVFFPRIGKRAYVDTDADITLSTENLFERNNKKNNNDDDGQHSYFSSQYRDKRDVSMWLQNVLILMKKNENIKYTETFLLLSMHTNTHALSISWT